MFWIRYTDASSNVIEKALTPGPTDVEYPERRAMNTMASQDGTVVVQRPLRDSRPRKWIWNGYPPGVHPPYDTLWAELQTLEYRFRLENGLTPLVEIWEDVNPEGGFNSLTGGTTKKYTTVKVLRVERAVAKGGGRIKYDTSTVEFVIQDVNYTGF